MILGTQFNSYVFGLEPSKAWEKEQSYKINEKLFTFLKEPDKNKIIQDSLFEL